MIHPNDGGMEASVITRNETCEICGNPAEQFLTEADYSEEKCERCGIFLLSGRCGVAVRNLSVEDKIKLSGWIRDQNLLGEVPRLTTSQTENICSWPTPRLMERADRLLTFAVRGLRSLGQQFNLTEPAFKGVTYSKNFEEVFYLARFLEQQGFIEIYASDGIANGVTPQGYMRSEKLRGQQTASTQGFVAMSFDESMRPAYQEGFCPGIRAAGYDPLRIDRVEHVAKIDDEIVAQIRRSRFVLADFTGHRGGVYFEAGFALGLNLPVIWTCRQDDVDQLHFDIRQFNTIIWDQGEYGNLSKRLRNRIEAVIGRGPRGLAVS